MRGGGSLTNGAGRTEWTFIRKNELQLYLTPYTEINFRWLKDLTIKARTLKLLEENLGEYLPNFRISKDVLGHKKYEP